MSALDKIAFFQNRRDEVPNQELAGKLAAGRDENGIKEIAENLWNSNPNIQSDCLKVLYEVGYLKPELIAEYVGEFLKLLKSKHNRLVWGSMIALSTLADLKPKEIYSHFDEVKKVMESGSVITVDNGVKTLALVAASDEARRKKVFPYLLKHLETCRPKEVPQHSEKTLAAVNAGNKKQFVAVLDKRLTDMTGAQMARVKRVIKEAEKRA